MVRFALFAMAVALSASPLQAQDPAIPQSVPGPDAGVRVRLDLPMLVRDAFQVPGVEAPSIPITDILRDRAARATAAERSFLIGAKTGSRLGGLFGFPRFTKSEERNVFTSRGDAAMHRATPSAPMGAAMGLVVGLVGPSELWRQRSPNGRPRSSYRRPPP